MEKPRVCGFDCFTNTVTDREMTDEEHAQWIEEIKDAPAPFTADTAGD